MLDPSAVEAAASRSSRIPPTWASWRRSSAPTPSCATRSVSRPHRSPARRMAALEHDPGSWNGRPVFLYGFDDLTREQLRARRPRSRPAPRSPSPSPTRTAGRWRPARPCWSSSGRSGQPARSRREPDPANTDSPLLYEIERGLRPSRAEPRSPTAAWSCCAPPASAGRPRRSAGRSPGCSPTEKTPAASRSPSATRPARAASSATCSSPSDPGRARGRRAGVGHGDRRCPPGPAPRRLRDPHRGRPPRLSARAAPGQARRRRRSRAEDPARAPAQRRRGGRAWTEISGRELSELERCARRPTTPRGCWPGPPRSPATSPSGRSPARPPGRCRGSPRRGAARLRADRRHARGPGGLEGLEPGPAS